MNSGTNFPPVIIEIRKSLILPEEIGVFAVRDLSEQQLIGDASLLGESIFFSWEQFNSFDEETRAKIMAYCLGNERGFYTLSNLNYLSVPWNMNHSCEGNVGFDSEGNFVTIRSIKKGEELLWDYGLGESNPNFTMPCKCGSKICRGVITGNDWKNNDFRHRNLKYMLPELK